MSIVNSRAAIVRDSIGKIVHLIAAKSIPVYLAGQTAQVTYNDDLTVRAVYLPAIPDDSSDSFLDAIQGFVDHECGHVIFTDFSATIGALDNTLMKTYWNILEDVFVERKMTEAFIGANANLSKTRQLLIKRIYEPQLAALNSRGAGPVAYWGLLTAAAMRAKASQPEFVAYMDDKWRLLDPQVIEVLDALTPRIETIQCTADALVLARKLYDTLHGKPAEASKPGIDPLSEPESGEMESVEEEIESEEVPGEGVDSEEADEPEPEPEGEDEDEDEDDAGEEATDEVEPEDGETEEAKPDESEAEDPAVNESEIDTEPPTQRNPSADEDEAGVDNEELEPEPEDDASSDNEETECCPPALGMEEPENALDYDSAMEDVIADMSGEAAMSSKYVPFSTSFDVLGPVEVTTPVSNAKLDSLSRDVEQMVGPLKQQLRGAFFAKSVRRWHGGLREGRINPGALARLRVGDDRVFRRREIQKTDEVAVTLLVDNSGSMGSGHGSRLDLAMKSAWALSATLTSMKVRHELLAFTTHRFTEAAGGHAQASEFERLMNEAIANGSWSYYHRHEPLMTSIIKTFNEPFGPEQKQRACEIMRGDLSCSNADGESVLIAARRLLARKEPGKILIVLSDGQPAFSGDCHAGRAHLRSVVKDLSKIPNFSVVGIGIQSPAVKEFYPRHVILQNLEELPTTVISEVRRILLRESK